MNKVVLITGTSKGIGRYLAEYYLQQNFRVIGCSRSSCTLNHENYDHIYGDVSVEKDVKKTIRFINTKYGKLDILINNAGTASMNHVLLTPTASVEKLFRTNYLGTFLYSRESAKLMKKSKFGRIVNFTTVASPLSLEGEAIYSSIKAGIEKLTVVLAKELGDFGITVNSIGPTPVQTALMRTVPADKAKELLDRQVFKRYGEFKDISNVIDFFISEESNFITGQKLFLGGVS
jgi:3-oxoacyl-[acyl-carrier protein] reductase